MLKNYNVDILLEYKNLINNEPYLFIVEEMLTDLKSLLLENSHGDDGIFILQEFKDINALNADTIIEHLIEYFVIQEGIVADLSKAISNMKSGFGDKHDKIVARDKKWLSKNKKNILAMDYEEVQLEVLSDYKVTFEQLVNRHNIFDKIFVNSENNGNLEEKMRRFEDKNGDLKNGLDNYFRTGTSRREIGLRKLAGEEAKVAVENMVAYCDSFLNGRKFLEEKMNDVLVAINDSKVEESYSVLDILKEADEIDKAMKDTDGDVEFVGEKKKDEPKEEKPKKKEEPEEDVGEEVEEPNNEEIDDENLEDEETTEEETEEPKRGIRDRHTGVAVLLTVAEARYFDYINILKGLVEE